MHDGSPRAELPFDAAKGSGPRQTKASCSPASSLPDTWLDVSSVPVPPHTPYGILSFFDGKLCFVLGKKGCKNVIDNI